VKHSRTRVRRGYVHEKNKTQNICGIFRQVRREGLDDRNLDDGMKSEDCSWVFGVCRQRDATIRCDTQILTRCDDDDDDDDDDDSEVLTRC